ncbi:MAG: glycosyltransferase family 4 protein, partial [Planctomycetota bacterium]|nr:glycosyltransferase family 4 protein [Planctomycetota bacterium]
MRILQLTPGTGSFHCGSCLRDHALIKALRDLGHDAQMIPLYLPHVVDATDGTKDQPVFFGGINAYLQQKSAFFRKTPRWLDKLFDSRGLLLQASKKAGMTSPEELGSMTLSMLKGENGHQIKELERLVSWLEKDGKPDLISLSNVLLIGMARRMKEQLNVPIVCTLQGEDTFIDSFPEPYKTQCWDLLKERAADINVFLGVSDYYGQLMRERMELAPEKMRVVYNGLTLEGWTPPESRPGTPVLGYLARMCPQKGLHTLVDAFIEVKKRGQVPGLKLRVAGAKTPADLPYVAEIQGRLRESGCLEDVDFQANISLEEKKAFLRSLSLLSVPALYGESFGLYVIEALAMGVPVLQPNHAAFPELLKLTEGGALFDQDDPEAYALAIEALFKTPDQLTEMGRKGHSAVHRMFGSDAMARAVQDIFEAV